MPFAYYAKLSAGRQRIYRQSDAIETARPPAGRRRRAACRADPRRAPRDDRAVVQAASQALIDALVTGYRVPRIRVRVLAQRPADETRRAARPVRARGRGEARAHHGLDAHGGAPRRRRVQTFLRTLVHELCHHLDYELYKLPETFHTEGFYKRESTLANALLAQESTAGDLPG